MKTLGTFYSDNCGYIEVGDIIFDGEFKFQRAHDNAKQSSILKMRKTTHTLPRAIPVCKLHGEYYYRMPEAHVVAAD
jgi:hypothetical protein